MKFLCFVVLLRLVVTTALAGNVELFTSLPAQFRQDHLRYEKKPTYIECGADEVTVWPGGTKIVFRRLNRPDHDLRPVLDDLETNAQTRCLIVVQRPGSARIFPALYRAIRLRRIEIAHEMIDAGTPVLDAVKSPEFVAGALARPLDRKPVYFECRGGAVFYVAKEELNAEVMSFINRYRPLSRREDMELMENRLRQATFGNEFYLIDGLDVLMGKVTLRPRPDSSGETLRQIHDEASAFRTRLAGMGARRQYAQFLVRDDSLAALRVARAVAEKHNLEWRFTLLEDNAPLQFAQ